jgi:hypothetical protein
MTQVPDAEMLTSAGHLRPRSLPAGLAFALRTRHANGIRGGLTEEKRNRRTPVHAGRRSLVAAA